MKKVFFILFCSMLFSAFINGGTIANIIEINKSREPFLIIDKGSADGVVSGQKGIIKAVYKDPSGEYEMNIGIFVVKKVTERNAELAIESLGQGFSIEDARYVVFDDWLKPKKSEKASEESVEKLIEQGDKFFDSQQYENALNSYQKAQRADPENLVLKDKINECQKRINLQKNESKYRTFLNRSAEELKKGQLKFALLYLYEAYRIYPEGKAEIKEKFLQLYQNNPEETASNLEEKKAEFGEIYNDFLSWLPASDKQKTDLTDAEAVILKKIGQRAKNVQKNRFNYLEARFFDSLIMIHIPASNFTIGSPPGQGDEDEHPAHKVFISDFMISKYEITFELFDKFCEEKKLPKPADEGWGRGKRPVINVSWFEAVEFCKWLSAKSGLKFRLPTEAEWEKTAHAVYPWGNKKASVKLANFNKIHGETVEVGSYPDGASVYGVEDLAGNVWEWCLDWYGAKYYQVSEKVNPAGPASGDEKVVRGGCWADSEQLIRSANRSSEKPEVRSNRIGFRVVLDLN